MRVMSTKIDARVAIPITIKNRISVMEIFDK